MDNLRFVRLEPNDDLGYRVLKLVKPFRRGDVVLQERPVAICTDVGDEERLKTFLSWPQETRDKFLEVFSQDELVARGLEVDDMIDGDSYHQLLEVARAVCPDIFSDEVAQVLGRWLLMQRVSQTHVYKHISSLPHSCSTTVALERQEDDDIGVLKAVCDFDQAAQVGLWLHDDVHVWWKCTALRNTSLIQSKVVKGSCVCDRCLGNDVCRAIQCPDCADGELVRNGLKQRWMCTTCDFYGSDDACAGFIAIERTLEAEFADVAALATSSLLDAADMVANRIGRKHWLFAALHYERYSRLVARDDAGALEYSFRPAASALCFLHWLSTRDLTPPPPVLMKEVCDMLFGLLDFLHRQVAGMRDLRVVFLRAVAIGRSFCERFDRSLLTRLAPFSGHSLNIRRKCAFCERYLDNDNGDDLDEEEAGGTYVDGVDARPRRCRKCRDLRYCDIGCQKADALRHRSCCIPKADIPSAARLVACVNGP